MSMSRNSYTRRDLLKAVAVGMAAIAMASCVSIIDKSPEGRTFTFVQISDTQLGMGGYEHDVNSFKQAVKQVNALKPDFVLICGDLVDNANEKSFADLNNIKAGFTMPCYCAPGNHDVGNEPTLESLKYYRKAVGKDFYSFEHKGCTFVIVNTQLWKAPVQGESEKHEGWFKATLKAASEKKHRIFIVGHHPLFIKKPDEDEEYMNLPLEKRKELLGLFEKRNVVAVLGGHTHKLIINNYKGIQLVNTETTSKNFDERALGFRLWHVVDPKPFKHDFIPLERF